MANGTISQPSFLPRQRWNIIGRVLLSLAAFLSVVVMANYLAARHFRRFEWTGLNPRELSPTTLRVLGSVTNTVKIIVFFDRHEPLFSSVKELLTEYERRCSKLEVEYVDYTLSPPRAKVVLDTYKQMAASEGDRIIFDANGKIKIVYANDLAEYDHAAIFRGEKIKRKAFKGEQLFTSAIYSVIDPKPTVTYFLLGHKEHNPTNRGDMGYFDFARVLEENNVTVRPLSGLLTNDVPDDCRLLIIAGPQIALQDEELARIEKYLNPGGRLFVLFNYNGRHVKTGLEKVLANWGVEVGHNTVRDPTQTQAGSEQTVVANHFGQHPIIGSLRDLRVTLMLPRSIQARRGGPSSADAPKVVELVTTSENGLAYVEPGAAAARVELTGAIAMIAAVEKGAIPGVSAGATRIVVSGDSFFLENGPIGFGANRDFLRNTANWLLNRELLLEGIGPRAVKEYRVTITDSEMKRLRWILLGALPGSVLFLGWLVWLRRKS